MLSNIALTLKIFIGYTAFAVFSFLYAIWVLTLVARLIMWALRKYFTPHV